MNAHLPATPLILVIESDNETRPLLVENLNNHGFQVTVAISLEEALPRLQTHSRAPTIILIDQVGLPVEEIFRQGRHLRQAANLQPQTPIVVMADRYGPDLEGTEVQVGEYDYIIYPEDARQLLNLLSRLCLPS